MSEDDDELEPAREFDEPEQDSLEGHIWQLLVLINPGDEETAWQQFADYREAAADASAEIDPLELVGRVIDWRSGFIVEQHDLRSLVQAIDELASRWNLSLDWGGDPDEDEFFDDMDAVALFDIAYDSLAGFGYTLWSLDTSTGHCAGWMTRRQDKEPMRELASELDIPLRLGSELS